LLLAVNPPAVLGPFLPAGLLRNVAEAGTVVYYPLLILACLGGLLRLNHRRDRETPGQHEKPAEKARSTPLGAAADL
jgi:hypothetical protein